ncbi:hypothetical protein FB451DRAFT_1167142 [Mycena latifolia]|nr:hypothetical protein FB451DRAFT_1167142 [Mycena latifolia]
MTRFKMFNSPMGDIHQSGLGHNAPVHNTAGREYQQAGRTVSRMSFTTSETLPSIVQSSFRIRCKSFSLPKTMSTPSSVKGGRQDNTNTGAKAQSTTRRAPDRRQPAGHKKSSMSSSTNYEDIQAVGEGKAADEQEKFTKSARRKRRRGLGVRVPNVIVYFQVRDFSPNLSPSFVFQATISTENQVPTQTLQSWVQSKRQRKCTTNPTQGRRSGGNALDFWLL